MHSDLQLLIKNTELLENLKKDFPDGKIVIINSDAALLALGKLTAEEAIKLKAKDAIPLKKSKSNK